MNDDGRTGHWLKKIVLNNDSGAALDLEFTELAVNFFESLELSLEIFIVG